MNDKVSYSLDPWEAYEQVMYRKQFENKEQDVTDYGRIMRELDAEKMEDVVNKPKHYNQSGIECIDAIKAACDVGYEYYLQGNIIKYLWRYRYKNGVEDLRKAEWYLKKLIEVKDV